MANPKPDLQGFADRPSEPGWQERAIERVRARQHKTRRANERKNGTYIFYDDPLRVLLDEACRRRNISLTGYVRRAMVAMRLCRRWRSCRGRSAARPAGTATGGGRPPARRQRKRQEALGIWNGGMSTWQVHWVIPIGPVGRHIKRR
jgi:hypothetical protein